MPTSRSGESDRLGKNLEAKKVNYEELFKKFNLIELKLLQKALKGIRVPFGAYTAIVMKERMLRAMDQVINEETVH